MLFLKDSTLNRPTTSNVISNYQSVNVDVSSLSRRNLGARSPSLARNESVKRRDTKNVVNESKRNTLPKPLYNQDTEDQASLELLHKEDEDNMEIPDADVSFAISI